ncbi:MAG: hypothetical protein ACRD2G_01280 [Terriglobia bacterium]
MYGFAVFTASVAYLAVITGALATSDGAGVSTSFGGFSLPHLLEWAKADGGHRITGTIVAGLTLALVAALLVKEGRRWVKWLGGIAALAVILQAVLGSLAARRLQIALTVSHSCMAQIYFCIVVSLAIFTHPKWRWDGAKALNTGKPALQHVALSFSIIVFVQIVLGAIYRDQAQSQMGQLGGIHSAHTIGVLPHIIGGGVVFVAALWLLVRVLKMPVRDPGLMVLTVGLAIMVMVQVFLGAGVYMMMRFSQSAPHPQVPVVPIVPIVIATVMHVALGALIFAGSVAVTYMAYRYSARPGASGAPGSSLALAAEPSR